MNVIIKLYGKISRLILRSQLLIDKKLKKKKSYILNDNQRNCNCTTRYNATIVTLLSEIKNNNNNNNNLYLFYLILFEMAFKKRTNKKNIVRKVIEFIASRSWQEQLQK